MPWFRVGATPRVWRGYDGAMPWTLYRYILRELVLLMVVSSLLLVVVLSLLASIKPLSEGQLGPATFLKYVLYTAPTVLVFALPFAGAFASTLVFLRMASENEVLVCRASGLSYPRVLLPVGVLGAGMAVGLFVLSNFVVPSFYKKMARTVQSDLIEVAVTQVNAHRPFELEDWVLYADRATQLDLAGMAAEEVPEALQGAETVVALNGVAVMRRSEDGEARAMADATASRAVIVVYRGLDGGEASVWVKLYDAVVADPERGGFANQGVVTLRAQVPQPFRDNPRFFSYPELMELERNPERYDEVHEAMDELTVAMSTQKLRTLLRAGLEGGGVVSLRGPLPGQRYLLRAGRVEREKSTGVLTLLGADEGGGGGGEPVTVVERLVGGEGEAGGGGEVGGVGVERAVTMRAGRAVVRVEQDELTQEPYVGVELYDVVSSERGSPTQTGRDHLPLPRLTWGEELFETPPTELSAVGLHRMSREPMFNSSATRAAAGRLGREMYRLGRQVLAQLNERAATAVSCLLLLLLGAVLSLNLREQMPLVVYLWSFMLAVVTLIIVYSGSNIITSNQVGSLFGLLGGIATLWSGNLLLLCVIAAMYWRLARR